MGLFDIDDTGYTFRAGHAYTFQARVRARSYQRMESAGNDIRAMAAGITAACRDVAGNLEIVGGACEAAVGTFYDTVQCRVNFTPNQDVPILALSRRFLDGFNAAARRAGVAETDLCRPYLYESDVVALPVLPLASLVAPLVASKQVVIQATVAIGTSNAPPTAGDGISGTLMNLGNRTSSTDPAREGASPLANQVGGVTGSPLLIAAVVVGGGILALFAVGVAAGNVARLVGR